MTAPVPTRSPLDTEETFARRAELLALVTRTVRNSRVLEVVGRLPRHFFAPGLAPAEAYADSAAEIGYGQTISQPSLVAEMSEALQLRGAERVLEIGTGSGYQAAILGALAAEVFSVEVVPELAGPARERLDRLGFANVHVRSGDGHSGWPEAAPFDRIILTAAPERVPDALVMQLAEGGILMAPVGPVGAVQRLLRCRKQSGTLACEELCTVRFVPMVAQGEAPLRPG